MPVPADAPWAGAECHLTQAQHPALWPSQLQLSRQWLDAVPATLQVSCGPLGAFPKASFMQGDTMISLGWEPELGMGLQRPLKQPHEERTEPETGFKSFDVASASDKVASLHPSPNLKLKSKQTREGE